MKDNGDLERPGASDETAFDVLIERMKRDISEAEHAQLSAHHAARFHDLLDAALREAAGGAAHAGERIHEVGEKARAEMKAHPAAAISSAFAAGYVIGKAIAGGTRK